MTTHLTAKLLCDAGFRHGFSLRTGGVSGAPFDTLNLARNVGDDPEAVRQNHLRFAEAVGYAPGNLYEVSQVHGARVEVLEEGVEPLALRAREADAIVSARPNTAVGVRVADCVPVLLAHPRSGAVAAVHAGWRGVVAGVVPSAVGALAAQVGAERSEFLAALGPHIGPDAFEVGHEVAAALQGCLPGVEGVVLAREPRPHVSLATAVRAQLVRAGLFDANVEIVEGCTFRESQRFFSFRRDGKRSGRHLAVIVARC